MTTAKRFEDLEVWQKARDVVNVVYQVSSTTAFSRAISIPSNIAEGFSRHSNKEFVQFLFIAKGSTAEVQSQLYTALDQYYISQENFDKIYRQLEVIAKQVSRLITYLKRSS